MSSSWNPLRCRDARLPVNVVLMVKLVALCLLLTRQTNLLPGPWKVVFVPSAIAVLFSRWTPLSSFAVGALILIARFYLNVSSGIDLTLCAFLLILAAFYQPAWRPRLSQKSSRVVILACVLLASSILLITGSAYNMFCYAAPAAALWLVDWPRSRWLVIYDGDCGFCMRSKAWFERLDLERLLEWRPFQSGAGREHGISDADATERVYLVAGTNIYGGFRAIRMMLLFNPITYLAMATALAAPGAGAALYRRIAVTLLLVFFLFTPLGEWGYRLVAQNRRRLGGNSGCATS